MLTGSPTANANLPGWISREIFVDWLKNFIAPTKSSKDNPDLFLVKNRDSHVTIEALSTAKENDGDFPTTLYTYCNLEILQSIHCSRELSMKHAMPGN